MNNFIGTLTVNFLPVYMLQKQVELVISKIKSYWWLVSWLFWGLTSIQRSFSHISTWKQEITNLWKFKWWGRESNGWLVGWLFWGLTSIQGSFSHISTWKQEITNLWKFKWRGRESNPGPLAPQAKSLTTRPLMLQNLIEDYSVCIMS